MGRPTVGVPAQGPISVAAGASWYQRIQAHLLTLDSRRYRLVVDPHKRRVLSDLNGIVVEIGPGGGVNLPFFPAGTVWIGVEPNPSMVAHILDRANELSRPVQVVLGRAEMLPFAAESVDAVVSSLVLCSVPDLAGTLAEIRRVLRPGGRFVFMEHVADPSGGRRGKLQRLVRPLWGMLADGCDPARPTGDYITRAGFSRVELERFEVPFPIVGPHIVGTAFR